MAALRQLSQTVNNHIRTMDAELIALHALMKGIVDAMQDELNLYKSEVAVIWNKLIMLLELAKKRKQQKNQIVEIIASKKRQREQEKRNKKEAKRRQK